MYRVAFCTQKSEKNEMFFGAAMSSRPHGCSSVVGQRPGAAVIGREGQSAG
jgi:hypothetical protein